MTKYQKDYKNHPYCKVLNFISKETAKQRDKYRDGEDNNLFQWEDFYDWFLQAWSDHLDEVYERVTKLAEDK